MVQVSPVGLIVSKIDGSFEYVNQAMLDMLGYSEQEIYQSELILTHPQDIEIGRRMRQRLLKNPSRPVVMEKRYVHKSGKVIVSLTSMTVLKNDKGEVVNFVAQVIDIEYRKKMEKSADLFRTMVNASRDAMFIIDPSSGKILDANTEGCDSLGYEYEEILDLNIAQVGSKIFDEAEWGEHVNKIRQQHHMLFYGEHRHKDTHMFPVEVSLSYLTQNDFEYLLAIVRDITERKKSEELIWRQANYDQLTDLPNRNMLYDRLKQGIKKALRSDRRIAVLCLDLDNFKYVNDTLGHDVGDKLLQQVGGMLNNCVREIDTVSRLGGDEFCVLIEQVEEVSHVDRIANAILAALSKPFLIGDHKVFTSTSVGIAFFPEDATSVEDLLKQSDQAMYFAKNKGRNCFQYFTEAMQEEALDRMSLSRDLHDALQQKQFYIEYQPIVSLKDNKVYKAEALLRWRHPERGLLDSAKFISIAEENGTIGRIGDFVFEQVLEALQLWRESIHPDFQLSINASPLQFREGQNHLHNWKKYLQEASLPGESLLIEIIEGIIMNMDQSVMDKMLMLRDSGIQVALDDFGTGYSSLAYLQKLDIDYLKIDRSFVKNLVKGSNEMILCEAIIIMAHRLNLKVVAEGIETRSQFDLLQKAGCDYGQGFYFSPSLSRGAFECFVGLSSSHDESKLPKNSRA